VDQLKQITSSLSNLIGADSTADVQQLTDVDMDRYISLVQTFTDKSHQLDTVCRQANDVLALSVIIIIIFIVIQRLNAILLHNSFEVADHLG